MKRWLPFVVPFVMVLVGGLLGLWLLGAVGSRTPPEDVPFVEWLELDPSAEYVRTSGMAHYGAVVTSVVPGNLVRDIETMYLFPLMAPYDAEERQIRVMVRTNVEPERFVTYELMTVEGWLSRLTPDKVPYNVEVQLGRSTDYYYAEDIMLLDVVVLEEGLDERVAPALEEE